MAISYLFQAQAKAGVPETLLPPEMLVALHIGNLFRFTFSTNNVSTQFFLCVCYATTNFDFE